jgi:hypothetical protein
MKPCAFIFLGICVGAVGATTVAAQEDGKSGVYQQTAMQSVPETSAQAVPQSSTQSTTVPSADKSKIVYVSDFELDAVEANGKLEKSVPAVAPSAAAQLDPKREQGPVEQAGRLVDFMATTLLKELERAGFMVHRLRPGDTRPSDGIRISGIFGEPDEQNRLRRAVMGRVTVDGKMALFVGISNLAKPDQAFYAVAEPSGADNKAGAVITVSSYAPVARFVIGKNTTEKVVKDTATSIVGGLNALLSANVVALTQ